MSLTAHRPVVMARRHAVSAGHYLAADAGLAVLDAGGNAVDAGVAACIALAVVHSDMVNVAGVAPIMVRLADGGAVHSIDGVGTWPMAVTPDFFQRRHGGRIPEGILRTVVPAAPAAWLFALERFGSWPFGDAAAAAIGFARDGFPMHAFMSDHIGEQAEGYRQWPSSRDIYLPRGRPPRPGEVFVQRDLARTLQYMADAEKARAGAGREAGLQAARDAFYKGDIAAAIADYHRANGGLLTMEDMATYQVRIEPTVPVEFGGMEVHCCGPWSQGPALAQTLGLLDGLDLRGLGHNSPGYIHVVTEALKLAFADRERHIGDPAFVEVPIEAMLSPSYLAMRRELIRFDRTWPGMPPPGDPLTPAARGQTVPLAESISGAEGSSHDTSYACVIDRDGNMFSATPSDSGSTTPVVPGTGLRPSDRGEQSWAEPDHPSSVAPGKRPRLTPNPALALKDGLPFMVFGSPGGDVQVQAMAQTFINVVTFGMDPQSAIEAPRFATYSFPSSNAPHLYFPGLLKLEGRLPPEVGTALSALGHAVEWWPRWAWRAGGACAILHDPDTGILHAAADPRRSGYALGR